MTRQSEWPRHKHITQLWPRLQPRPKPAASHLDRRSSLRSSRERKTGCASSPHRAISESSRRTPAEFSSRRRHAICVPSSTGCRSARDAKRNPGQFAMMAPHGLRNSWVFPAGSAFVGEPIVEGVQIAHPQRFLGLVCWRGRAPARGVSLIVCER